MKTRFHTMATAAVAAAGLITASAWAQGPWWGWQEQAEEFAPQGYHGRHMTPQQGGQWRHGRGPQGAHQGPPAWGNPQGGPPQGFMPGPQGAPFGGRGGRSAWGQGPGRHGPHGPQGGPPAHMHQQCDPDTHGPGRGAAMMARRQAFAHGGPMGQGRPFGGRGQGQFGPGPRGRRGGMGGPGQGPGERGIDREEIREHALGRLKEGLEIDDEAWTDIEPLLGTITEARAAQMQGRRAMMRGRLAQRRGGPELRGPDVPDEIEALQEALDSPDADADEIKAKVDAVRAARAEAEKAAAEARAALRTKLTPRQEARLLLMGLLD